MKLIIIHGTPAVGKYTIAKELKKITGYKLINIHVIYDLLREIFDAKKAKTFFDLLNKIHIDIFEEASKQKLKGLIFTYGDITVNHFKFIKEASKRIKKYKGELNLIHLTCNKEKLLKRIKGKSRKKFGKVKNKEKLKEIINNWNFETIFPNSNTLKIDNTNLSPKLVANKIKKHYNLK